MTTFLLWTLTLFMLHDGSSGHASGRMAMVQDHHSQKHQTHQNACSANVASQGYKQLRYETSKTKPFLVSSLPDVNYDIGELYSGLMPIDMNDSSRALFFVFQPTTGNPVDEITIWLNGGPGCSSLEGFLQENGRFTWQPGTYQPVENQYSWVNLTNVLWVDQPVGAGFSIGEVTATNEEDVARDFINFFKNFEKTFGICNYKIYVTGESYAGMYVPYISSAMIAQNDTEYFNLSGAIIYDPIIGNENIQVEFPVVPFVVKNNNMLGLNDSTIAQLQEADQTCQYGYSAFRQKYLTFPPPGVQPVVTDDDYYDDLCDVFDAYVYAALEVNPCFNFYTINQQCPLLWDVLGAPSIFYQDQTGGCPGIYFNRSDVKAAMHAPSNVNWLPCGGSVFVNDTDNSAYPIQEVLPQLIEKTNRVLISNGDLDGLVFTNGTLLAIQNMTWGGKLGLQTYPNTPINLNLPDLQYASVFDNPLNGADGEDGPQGVVGIQHYERGLMWAETFLSGHKQPQYQARVSYRHLEWMLGYTETL